MGEQPGWAIAITEPNRDFTAEQSLRREGYRVIFLYYRKRLTGHRGDWRKTTAFVSRPLIEGYGFVQVCPGQEWPDPARVQGFARLLFDGSKPALLDDNTVTQWQRRAQLGEWDDRAPEKPKQGVKFKPANSEDERKALLSEFMAKLTPQYAVAS